MYESFYGLSAKPFQLNPDPTFFYDSKEHRRAMSYLEYGLHKKEGFIVITGEIGAGKTTVLRHLLSKIDPKEVVAVQLVSTHLNADDTLRMVGAAFGVPVADSSKSEMLLAIEAFLLQLRIQGKRALLIVDEAQNLTLQSMEELRMLSNYQLDNEALLQSFLVGQPEFRSILENPRMEQLRQRIIAACHISPMDAFETREYVRHRLTHVGWAGRPHFEDDAYDALFEATEGVPRRINSLCDRVFLAGFLAEKVAFDAEDIRAAAREIHDETRFQAKPGTSAPVNGSNAEGLLDELGIDLSGLDENDIERRLERLERMSARTLAILKHLLNAARTRQAAPGPGEHE